MLLFLLFYFRWNNSFYFTLKPCRARLMLKIWRYWSIATDEPLTFTAKSMAPDGQILDVTKTVTDKRCIDELLYDKGMKIRRETESFKKLLKSVSVTSYKDE